MTGKHPSQAQHVVDVLGGRQSTAEIADEPITTIDSWLRSRWIHGKYHRKLIENGRAAGKPIGPIDFLAHLGDIPLFPARGH